MIIVIDAYNYIKSIAVHKFVDEAMIQSWIAIFQNYMALRGNNIVLVFDAGPSFYQSKEMHGGVEVIYAGHSQTADDVLKIWLESHAAQDVLLVTSDRQIRSHALNLGVLSLSSQDFYKIFNAVVKQEEVVEQKFGQTIHKTKRDHGEQECDLDQLMEQGSRSLVSQDFKPEYDDVVRIRGSLKMSKSDRKIMKKIDKI